MTLPNSSLNASSPSHKWLIVLIIGNVVFGLGLFFHAFLYNFYLQELGHTEAIMGYAAAALTAGGLAGLLPAGFLSDRIGPRPTLVFASLVAVGGLTGGAIVSQPMVIYWLAALSGLGGGLWRVAVGPALVRLTSVQTRPRAFAWNVGILVAFGGLGIAGAGSIPVVLEAMFPIGRLGAIRLALIVGAGFTALSTLAFVSVRIPHQAIPSSSSSHQPGNTFTGRRHVVTLIAFIGLWMLGPALAAQFFNIFFSRAWDIPLDRIGLIFAAGHLLAGLAVLASGELATRIGVVRALAIPLFLYAPLVWGLGFAQAAGFAIALYVLQGLISPITNPLIDQMLFARTPPSHHGQVSSWRNAAADLSAMLGAAIAGQLLQQTSFQLLFLLSGAIGLAGSLGLVWWIRTPTGQVEDVQPSPTRVAQ